MKPGGASGDDALSEMLSWAAISGRDDDGIFVGGEFSGKGLHVDQRPESNLGKQWRGLKLFAAWPPGPDGQTVLDDCYGEVFCPPLLAKHVAALAQCTQLLLLRPGDVFLFNGAMPHTALCVGEPLNVTSYEGLLTWNPGHIGQFLTTASSFSGPWREVGLSWKWELLHAWQEARAARSQGGEAPLAEPYFSNS